MISNFLSLGLSLRASSPILASESAFSRDSLGELACRLLGAFRLSPPQRLPLGIPVKINSESIFLTRDGLGPQLSDELDACFGPISHVRRDWA